MVVASPVSARRTGVRFSPAPPLQIIKPQVRGRKLKSERVGVLLAMSLPEARGRLWPEACPCFSRRPVPSLAGASARLRLGRDRVRYHLSHADTRTHRRGRLFMRRHRRARQAERGHSLPVERGGSCPAGGSGCGSGSGAASSPSSPAASAADSRDAPAVTIDPNARALLMMSLARNSAHVKRHRPRRSSWRFPLPPVDPAARPASAGIGAKPRGTLCPLAGEQPRVEAASLHHLGGRPTGQLDQRGGRVGTQPYRLPACRVADTFAGCADPQLIFDLRPARFCPSWSARSVLSWARVAS